MAAPLDFPHGLVCAPACCSEAGRWPCACVSWPSQWVPREPGTLAGGPLPRSGGPTVSPALSRTEWPLGWDTGEFTHSANICETCSVLGPGCTGMHSTEAFVGELVASRTADEGVTECRRPL